MGSIAAAEKVGYICRICAVMTVKMVHIYGARGIAMDLKRKIEKCCGVKIHPYDPLPKTVCFECFAYIINTSEWLEKILEAQKRMQREKEHRERAQQS